MAGTYVELVYCWNENGDCIHDPRVLVAIHPLLVPNGIQHSIQADCVTMSRVYSQPFPINRQPAVRMQIMYFRIYLLFGWIFQAEWLKSFFWLIFFFRWVFVLKLVDLRTRWPCIDGYPRIYYKITRDQNDTHLHLSARCAKQINPLFFFAIQIDQINHILIRCILLAAPRICLMYNLNVRHAHKRFA